MTKLEIERTPSAYFYPLLIKNLLRPPLIYSPHQEIIYRNRMRYDYLTFEKRVARLANSLKKLDVRKGDTVAVMDWDSHRFLECFFAIPMTGAVLHTINVRFSPEEIIYTINHAEDDVIIVNADFLPKLEAVKNQFTTVKKIILINETGALPETSLKMDGEYEDLLAESQIEYDFPDFNENTIATIFYTAGTTGWPKGVYFSHRQIVLHTYGLMSGLCAYKSQVSLDSGDVYMPLTPMFRIHSWGLPYLCTLLGTKQVYPGHAEPETILKLIEKEGVTFSHCVSTVMHMLMQCPVVKDMDLSRLKIMIAGSSLPKDLCKEAMDLGINLFSSYGMSETCPLLTVANLKPHMLDWDLDKQVEIRSCAGLPVPLVQLEVIDWEGMPVPHDGKSTGEIVARTPWLTQGYIKDPEGSEMLWKNGWLHTGDIGNIDPEGYLQVTDRLKDIIKTGGEWISVLKLEEIIIRHEAVMDAAVVGVPDKKWGERPLVLLVLKDEYKGKVEEKDFKDFYKKFADAGILPRYGIPDRVVIVDHIAKSRVGKIDKKIIREQFD
ncbi:MAG TPA: fatty acid--CoA ligase [Desulfobacterales bacterium]|nr:fatty acid--CoA ligase [Desulfobacterales bacterium]